MLASPSSAPRSYSTIADSDREGQADQKSQRQRGDADADMVAEIVGQVAQRLAPSADR